jgi:hypothetical protein
MNIKEMKKRIYALLDISPFEDESAVTAAIMSAARKTAILSKCIKKSEKIIFAAASGGYAALLPADFAAFRYIRRGTRVYGRERFEIIAERIKSAEPLGECELVYFAYPPMATSDETVLFADEYACDTAVYGAAMELLSAVRPADVQRYMRLATEYDERMANMISSACAGIANGFFAGRGGAFI